MFAVRGCSRRSFTPSPVARVRLLAPVSAGVGVRAFTVATLAPHAMPCPSPSALSRATGEGTKPTNAEI